jgi:hypothetical protein
VRGEVEVEFFAFFSQNVVVKGELFVPIGVNCSRRVRAVVFKFFSLFASHVVVRVVWYGWLVSLTGEGDEGEVLCASSYKGDCKGGTGKCVKQKIREEL